MAKWVFGQVILNVFLFFHDVWQSINKLLSSLPFIVFVSQLSTHRKEKKLQALYFSLLNSLLTTNFLRPQPCSLVNLTEFELRNSSIYWLFWTLYIQISSEGHWICRLNSSARLFLRQDIISGNLTSKSVLSYTYKERQEDENSLCCVSYCLLGHFPLHQQPQSNFWKNWPSVIITIILHENQ